MSELVLWRSGTCTVLVLHRCSTAKQWL